MALRAANTAHTFEVGESPGFTAHTKSSQATGAIVEHVAIELLVDF